MKTELRDAHMKVVELAFSKDKAIIDFGYELIYRQLASLTKRTLKKTRREIEELLQYIKSLEN